MIVGLNPAPTSVQAGHYYQGRSGQRQLRRLAQAGLFAEPDGSYFEDAALAAGVGFTDLVKRPTVGERGVTKEELEFGRQQLTEAWATRRVPLVICVFRQPVQALLGSVEEPGWQSRHTESGARVFRMPGPFAAADLVTKALKQLSD